MVMVVSRGGAPRGRVGPKARKRAWDLDMRRAGVSYREPRSPTLACRLGNACAPYIDLARSSAEAEVSSKVESARDGLGECKPPGRFATQTERALSGCARGETDDVGGNIYGFHRQLPAQVAQPAGRAYCDKRTGACQNDFGTQVPPPRPSRFRGRSGTRRGPVLLPA